MNLLPYEPSVEMPEREVACDCKEVADRHPTSSGGSKNNNGIAFRSLAIRVPLSVTVV